MRSTRHTLTTLVDEIPEFSGDGALVINQRVGGFDRLAKPINGLAGRDVPRLIF